MKTHPTLPWIDGSRGRGTRVCSTTVGTTDRDRDTWQPVVKVLAARRCTADVTHCLIT